MHQLPVKIKRNIFKDENASFSGENFTDAKQQVN